MLFSLAVSAALWLAMAHEGAGALAVYGVPIFRHLVLHQDFYALPPFIAVLLLALAAPLRAVGAALAAWCGAHPGAVAAATTLALAIGTHLVYHAQPLAMDEYAPLFQSKVFAAGALAGRFPSELVDWLIPKFFQGVFFKADAEGAVVSAYWPGFALLLTPFSALGVPWLLNPLIGGATVLVMHRLGRELFADDVLAGYVVLFTVASPAVTINALSYYSMSAHLLANALFALLLLKPGPRAALLAGVVGSVALVLHNPVPHLLFALPWIVWLATRPDALRRLAALFAGYLPLALAVGFGWAIFFRSFGTAASAAELATPAAAAEMVRQSAGGILRLPSEALIGARLWGLAKLWLWAAPALVTAALLGLRRAREERGVWLALAGSALLTLAAYFFVPFDQGHGWGYRYFHPAWSVLPLFAAAAIARHAPLRGYLAACALLSLVALSAFRALQVEHFVDRHLDQLPAAAARGAARVVFVDPGSGYYAWDLVQNDPFLRDRKMILISQGRAKDEAMMAQRFPHYVRLAADRRGSVWGTR